MCEGFSCAVSAIAGRSKSLVRSDGLRWRRSVEVWKGLTPRTVECGISSRRPLLNGLVGFSRKRCVFCARA